ncbi:hypothetical protein E2320_009290 [Naja naja]|nr:hypothetical protein E2320_009290 [Naja naja]
MALSSQPLFFRDLCHSQGKREKKEKFLGKHLILGRNTKDTFDPFRLLSILKVILQERPCSYN